MLDVVEVSVLDVSGDDVSVLWCVVDVSVLDVRG